VTLTPEERARNVRRVEEAEKRLEALAQSQLIIVTTAASTYRAIWTVRNELRAALLKEPDPDLPPIVVNAAAAAVAETLRTLAGDGDGKRQVSRAELRELAERLDG
jgi:adenylylsulfate kinase-like enzyme